MTTPVVPVIQQNSQLLGTLCGLALVYLIVRLAQRKLLRFPCVNYRWWEITYRHAKQRYLQDTRGLLRKGLETFQGPFYLITDFGPLLIMPGSLLEAMDKHSSLDFRAFTGEDNLSDLETFRIFRDPVKHLTEDAVKRGLTRSLSRFTEQLSEEAELLLQEKWGSCPDWTLVDFRDLAPLMISRLSASVFLGNDLARNKDWLRISVDFTITANQAVQAVRLWPAALRGIASRLLPICRKFRAEMETASQILAPVLRRKSQDSTEEKGEHSNSVDWFRLAAKGRPYSDLDAQLGLIIGAIHTTSDLLVEALIQLSAHPEIIPPLREEASSVLAEHGWQSAALHKLRLLDSFLKETQRLKPIAMITMQRRALQDIVLDDGTALKQGDRMAVASHCVFNNDASFNAFRFVGEDATTKQQHFVTIDQQSLGFGYGKHACPGRFFVAAEVKVALATILLKYDLHLQGGQKPRTREYGLMIMSDPDARIEIRSR